RLRGLPVPGRCHYQVDRLRPDRGRAGRCVRCPHDPRFGGDVPAWRSRVGLPGVVEPDHAGRGYRGRFTPRSPGRRECRAGREWRPTQRVAGISTDIEKGWPDGHPFLIVVGIKLTLFRGRYGLIRPDGVKWE